MTIWVPDSARETPAPRFACRICGDRFVLDGAYEQHVIKCARVHDNELQEFTVEQHQREWDIPDPEWEMYNRALRHQGIDPDVQFSRNRRRGIRRAGES